MRGLAMAGGAAVLLSGLGYLVAGPTGILGASVIVAVLGASGARLAAAGRPFVPPEPADPHRPPDFPSFRRISATLRWTRVNGRYHDAVTRPLLLSITAALLSERRHLDLHHDGDRARDLIGSDGWALLYDAEPRDRDDPVALTRIASLIDRLERL